jgi:hypothetical protein
VQSSSDTPHAPHTVESLLRVGRIADHPINRLDELLPWNIGRPAEEQRQAA